MAELHVVKNEWWTDPENLHALCHHLVVDEGYSASELLDVIEKPWHWTADYEKVRREQA